jgi:predicted dithiol-disulfide oxidoreductase (DUF899 family)
MAGTYVDKKVEKRAAKVEKKLFRLKEKAAAIRRSERPRAVPDYVFQGHDGKPLKLSQAFGEKKDLVVVHNMGTGCPYCTLWADGFVSLLPHLEDRTAFLVVSPDPVAKQKAFHKSRGWTFRMASAHGTPFYAEMGFQDKEGNVWPGFTTFRKRGKKVERLSRRFFGPGDDYCSAWHFFDLLDGGTKDWQPKFRYT